MPAQDVPVEFAFRTDGPERFNARGWSGLDRWGGRVNETFLNDLRGHRGIKVFREMRDTDPVVGAGLVTTSMLIRAVPWSVQPASDSAEDIAAAAFLEECMHDMDHGWDDMVDEALSMLVFGWSYHEVVYKIRGGQDNHDPRMRSKYADGRLGWRSIRLRGQETLDRWQWDPEETETLLGLWQSQEKGPAVFIPYEKAVHFRVSKHKDNPEGRSLLTNAYRPWRFKREMEILEGIGVERDLVGIPKALVPAEILAADATGAAKNMRNYLEQILGDLKNDERSFILFPHEEDGYKLELLNSPGTKTFQLDPILERKSREIAYAMLMDFLLLGHEKVGTQSLAGTKVDVYKTAIHGWVEAIEDAVNSQLVPRLFSYQGLAMEEYPEITGGKVSTLDIMGKMAILEGLSRAGSFMFTGPPLDVINTILRDADLPEVDEEQYDESRVPIPIPGAEDGDDKGDGKMKEKSNKKRTGEENL